MFCGGENTFSLEKEEKEDSLRLRDSSSRLSVDMQKNTYKENDMTKKKDKKDKKKDDKKKEKKDDLKKEKNNKEKKKEKKKDKKKK